MSTTNKTKQTIEEPRPSAKTSKNKPKKILVPTERGVKLIHNPVHNKGTAFTENERQVLGLKGLLPPRIINQDLQADRIMGNLRKKPDDLEKYVHMVSLQDRNENLFYYVLQRHLEELMPIIYTPTVGRACQSFGHIYRRSRGFYISLEDRGHIKEILLNWPHKDVKVIGVLLDRRLQAPKRGQIHAPLTPLYVMNGLHKDTTPTGTVLNFVLQRPVSLQ